MTEAPLGALPADQRLLTLDILRGVALMGILIMNMPGFGSSFFAEANGSHLWPGRVDQVAEQVRNMLFSGKFNSMFSLLFGLGFTLQYERMRRHDPATATARYARRLAALAAFGAIHALVFWPGDILHMYAILGLVLLLGLRHLSDRTIVGLIVACLVLPALSGLLRLAIVTPGHTADRVAKAQALEASNNLAYGQGSFLDAMAESMKVMAHFYGDRWGLWNEAIGYLMFALTMMIGVLAGRRRWAERIPELMPQVRRLLGVSLALGLGCGLAFTVIFELNRVPGPSPIKIVGGVCYGLSRVSMMVFYVLGIVWLAQRPGWARRLAPWAAAGRMPLTNYLMQTLIAITLFHGWGLGLWGKVGPALGLVLALVIFLGVQVPWSLWWLRRHERGPMEALWSRLTYGRAAPTARLRAASR